MIFPSERRATSAELYRFKGKKVTFTFAPGTPHEIVGFKRFELASRNWANARVFFVRGHAAVMHKGEPYRLYAVVMGENIGEKRFRFYVC